jgi:hypothetical protein
MSKSCWYPHNCPVCSGCNDLVILEKVIPTAEKLDFVGWLKYYNRKTDIGNYDDSLYGKMSNLGRLWADVFKEHGRFPEEYICCITGRASVLLNGKI